MAPKGVADRLLFHQIDFAAEDFGQLILHLHPIIEIDATAWFETHQHVYIAISLKIIS